MTDAKPKEWLLGSPKKPVSEYDWVHQNPYDNDLANEMESILERGEFTPDFPELNRKAFQYLFVYGTLRKDFRNHKYLLGSEMVGCGFTAHDRFFMAVNKKGRYPVLLFDNRENMRAKVYGEVFKVKSEQFQNLDFLESNGTMYKRHLLTTLIWDSSAQAKIPVRAWIYVGKRDFWEPRIDLLEGGRKIKPNNGSEPYWLFTHSDQ